MVFSFPLRLAPERVPRLLVLSRPFACRALSPAPARLCLLALGGLRIVKTGINCFSLLTQRGRQKEQIKRPAFFIQSEGLACNQRACALYGISIQNLAKQVKNEKREKVDRGIRHNPSSYWPQLLKKILHLKGCYLLDCIRRYLGGVLSLFI